MPLHAGWNDTDGTLVPQDSMLAERADWHWTDDIAASLQLPIRQQVGEL